MSEEEALTLKLNAMTYQYYYDWLKLIALNAFKWENVPDTVDVKYMEKMLFETGRVAFFYDNPIADLKIEYNPYGYLALPINYISMFDPYGNPIKYQAFSTFNSYSKQLNWKDSVIIYNNYLKQSSENIVEIFARKLANLSRTIDVNINAQRTPVVVMCDKNTQLTFENLIEDYSGNKPFIFVNKKINLDSVKVLDTKAPFVADKMEVLLHNTLNDFLSNYGVENGNTEKKERMTPEEVASNYGVVEKGRNIYLSPREEACDKINKMYKLNPPMSVSFNTDLITLINQTASIYGGGANIG